MAKNKTKWFYVYVGYYECVITDKKLNAPWTYASKHKSVFNAERLIEREYPSAEILYDKDIEDDTDFYWVDEPGGEDYERYYESTFYDMSKYVNN